MNKRILWTVAALAFAALAVAPSARADYNLQLFAGYYFPEELDEDLSYGLRFGGRPAENWGWEVTGEWFDVADSQGFGGADVDADLFWVDFSFDYHPGGGEFYFFGGPGFVTAKIQDVTGFPGEEFSDDVFSIHGGVGYDILVGESFFIPLEARARWYELSDIGPSDKETQLDYEASVGLGWRFGGE